MNEVPREIHTQPVAPEGFTPPLGDVGGSDLPLPALADAIFAATSTRICALPDRGQQAAPKVRGAA